MMNNYLKWIYELMCQDDRFTKLIEILHHMEFYYMHPYDVNRYEDGINLRDRYSYFTNDYIDYECNNPCSILEMIAALAIRCEENIMDDPEKGDRTSQWFWVMLVSLGLGNMDNEHYDEDYIYKCVDDFLSHKYEPNGKGGLFTIKGYTGDMRDIEIWDQLCIYLNTIS